jgi:hypothetical protein
MGENSFSALGELAAVLGRGKLAKIEVALTR